jgi:hypothetical protein
LARGAFLDAVAGVGAAVAEILSLGCFCDSMRMVGAGEGKGMVLHPGEETLRAACVRHGREAAIAGRAYGGLRRASPLMTQSRGCSGQTHRLPGR